MNHVKKWMETEAINQRQLALWLGKTQAAVSKILSGQNTLHPHDAKILIAKSKGSLNWEKIYGGKA